MTSGALLLVVGAVALNLAEGQRSAAANDLGYVGPAVRIVATAGSATTPFLGPQQLTSAVVEFAADRRMSVAYSRANVPDLITVLDPDARFAVVGGRLAAGLAPGDGRRAAAISTLVAPANRMALLPDGVQVAGEYTPFSPPVAFDSAYPVALLDVDAAPFDSGIYLFVGDAASDPTLITQFFENNGMTVQHVAIDLPPTLQSTFTGVYGGIVITLAGVITAAALLIAGIHSALGRDRLIAAAVLGATRSNLGGLVLRRLVRPVLAGILIGAAACVGGLLAARGLRLTPIFVALQMVLAAVVICLLVWAAILTVLTAWETRRCRRAVIC